MNNRQCFVSWNIPTPEMAGFITMLIHYATVSILRRWDDCRFFNINQTFPKHCKNKERISFTRTVRGAKKTASILN